MSAHASGAPAIEDAQRLFRLGRLADARATTMQLLEKVPSDVDGLQLLGLIAQQDGDPEQALRLLARAAQLAPSRADLLTNLGNQLRALERREEARSMLERAVRLAPDHGLILVNLGLVYQDLEQRSQAEAAFRRAVAVQPDLAAGHHSLGHLLMQSDPAQARQHLIRALQLSPGMHAAFKDLCAVLISSGDPAPALALCTRRLQAAPTDQDALAIKALALHGLGRAAEAQQMVDFDQFLRRYAQSAPPGYASVQDFNADLEAHVRSHPKLTSVLFGQATHHARRVNDLLAEPKGPVGLLEQMVVRQIRAARSAWPATAGLVWPAEGLPARTRMRAWAVLMQRHGYETPHIHPDGLISGVYYVCLPAVVADRQAAGAGWIEFGAPDPVYASRSMPPVRPVQPEAGTMLLFPSFFWHRTIPFDSDTERLSIAFDLSYTT